MKNLLIACSSLLSLVVLADPARIAWPKACASDALVKGARIFTDRDYVFNEPPAGLKGRPFLRGSIMNTRFDVVSDGERQQRRAGKQQVLHFIPMCGWVQATCRRCG